MVTAYPLDLYPCGLRTGDRVRLRKKLLMDRGRVHKAGEVWTVLAGAAEEPNLIQLLRPDGNRHHWPDDTFAHMFELLPHSA